MEAYWRFLHRRASRQWVNINERARIEPTNIRCNGIKEQIYGCIVPCIFYFQVPVVGSARFELANTNAGVKFQCLTAWRRPNMNIPTAFYLSVCKRYPSFRYPLVFAVPKFLCTYTRSAKWSCDRLVRALIETSITYCYEAVWWLRPVFIA